MSGEILTGGFANPGAVVRFGDRVRRPRRASTPSVHRFLGHLESVGFAGSPRVVGLDDDHEELTFVEGDVGERTTDAWVADDELLVSVAWLQRDLHEAASSYAPPTDALWGVPYLPYGLDGPLVCHNDLCVSNVIVRDGRAAAFIDFDYAAPVEPLFDVGVALRHWLPVGDPADLEPHFRDLDRRSRFDAYCDVFDLRAGDRRRVIVIVDEFLERAYSAVETRARAGESGFAAMWADGYPDVNRRARAWLRQFSTR